MCQNIAGRSTVACILPGVVTGALKIITGDFKQGSKVVTAAFQTLAGVIQVALNDQANRDILDKPVDPLATLRAYADGQPVTQELKADTVQDTPTSPLDQKLDRQWLKVGYKHSVDLI